MRHLRNIYSRFSPTLWVLAVSRLVDMTTLWMAIPFMSLFLKRAGASDTLTGMILALNPIASVFGGLLGGQVSDVRGRKPVLLGAMSLRVMVLLGYAFATQVWQFAILAFLNGLVASFFQPAFTAAIADVTPPERRPEAYSLSRVASNLGVGLGPLLGGLLGVSHQTLIFLIAATSTTLAGLLIFRRVPETLPDEARRALSPRAAGGRDVLSAWATVFQDWALLIFVLAGLLSQVAYQQINSTYAVTLVSRLANYDRVYGMIWTINGLLVVLLQIPITALFERFPMAVAAMTGCLTFALGYLLFAAAAVSVQPLAIYLAAVVWTLGEIVLAVPQSSYVTDIAPEAIRARYAGAAGLPWALGGVIGPTVGTTLKGIVGGPAVMAGVSVLAVLAGFLFLVAERERSRRLAALASVHAATH
ncbi:MAG: MDR family MFS transporter [Bacillota bacterium]